jgi:ketosteroid isomerase-like protein
MHAPTLTTVDVSAIKATINQFTSLCIKRDWDAFLKLCTDDAVFLPPDEPILTSIPAIRAWLEKYPIIKRFEFEFDHIEGQENLAVTYGHFSMTVEVEKKPAEVSGKFIDTFRKDDHGKWRYALICWNSNAPRA